MDDGAPTAPSPRRATTATTVDRRRRGAAVEAAARTYLLQAGLREVAANASYRIGEIDLVMLDPGTSDGGMSDEYRCTDDTLGEDKFDPGMPGEGRLAVWRPRVTGRVGATLVFVEVRYRRDARFGGGAASVDFNKRRKLVRAAQLFLLSHREFANAACRFDVVEADGDPDAPRLNWVRDAFRLDDC